MKGARNIDAGIHRTVASKLRERGISAGRSEVLATELAPAAKAVFEEALFSLGTAGPADYADGRVDTAFDAVTEWVGELAIDE